MSNDLNQCNFIGRLGADPENRVTADGTAVSNFRIAVGWKSKDKEGAEWVPVVSFGKQAELCGQYLKKGSRVYISGKFKTRKWSDKSGQDRYSTEIALDHVQFLDSKPEGSQRPAAAQGPASGSDDQYADDEDIPY